MNQHKAYKFRIYPNQEQATLINKTIGCTRFVFNHFLGKQKDKDAYWYIAEETMNFLLRVNILLLPKPKQWAIGQPTARLKFTEAGD